RAELGGQDGEREGGLSGGARGGDGQREGKPCAAGDDVVDRVRFAAGPAGAEAASEQFAGFSHGEQVQRQRNRALPGDQAGEVSAAGHEGHAAGRPGEQRADLLDVACIVQHDEHAPAGEQAPVQPSPAGIPSAGTPSAARNPCIAAPGSSACPAGSKPRRLTYSWPSGNRAATRCAQCTASAVLPTPAVPDTAVMTAAGGAEDAAAPAGGSS